MAKKPSKSSGSPKKPIEAKKSGEKKKETKKTSNIVKKKADIQKQEKVKKISTPKLGFVDKIKISTKTAKKRVGNSVSKIKENFFRPEIHIKGREPPKSYSSKKAFAPLYIVFVVYSLLLIWLINVPGNLLISILFLFNPFIFGVSILAFFIVLSFLISNDKFREFIYEEKTAIKQITIYPGIFMGLYFVIFTYLSTNINYVSILLSLSMIWLLLLSTRFYTLSRKSATKIESRFIARYSAFRYGVALIAPFLIVGILIVISLFYRVFIVFLALDFFGNNNPASAVATYSVEMRLIMPLIYVSLILTLLFIVFEFMSTRRRAETKRSGCFDNFTFSFMILFIFFFQLFQITIFLLLRPEFMAGLRSTVGATSTTASFIFLFEFFFSMFFLSRIIKKMNETFGGQILFFKRDGLILFFLACVFAQTLSRFSLSSHIPNQEVTGVGIVLMADRFIISILMIVLIGFTLLIYYLKPHETSMFMRLQKETVREEDKSMDTVYRMIRSEYIRRGEPYPLEILERELIKATKLSKGIVYSLVKRLVEKDMDIVMNVVKNTDGKTSRMIDFISVTEVFEKKGVARKKAQEYMSKRLLDTISADKRKTIRLSKNLKKDKATDIFISSLTSDYRKKQKDAVLFDKKVKEKQKGLIFKTGKVNLELKNTLIDILKNEYKYRLEDTEQYPDFTFSISEISTKIQMSTKINPGELYPILEKISKADLELMLIKNPDLAEDKKIKFFPIADDEISNYLKNFRPEEYSKVKILVNKKLISHLKTKKTNSLLASLKRPIPKDSKIEVQRIWYDVLNILYNYYPIIDKQLKYIQSFNKVEKELKIMTDLYMKKSKVLLEKKPKNIKKLKKDLIIGFLEDN